VTQPVALAAAADPDRFGNKTAGLARYLGRVPVPPAIALPGDWLWTALPAGPAAELAGLLDLVAGCPDAELPGLVETIGRVAGSFRLTPAMNAQLTGLTGELGPLLVVRSSSADEDGGRQSFAGVFESLLDVAPSELAAAVRQVWLSATSPKALLQYRRAGLAARPRRLGVLVQRAIRPECAGVAFSEPTGQAYLEWAVGHGMNLVGGSAVPCREQLVDAAAGGWRGQLHRAIAELAADGTGHDIEWAYDGEQLWVVQVRPRTAVLAGHGTGGVRSTALYEADAPDLVLGDCAEVYGRIRRKRRLPRAIALAHGARVPGGWLVNWNPAAPVAELRDWSRQLPRQVVLDASSTERQYIIDRDELADLVTRLSSSSEDSFPFLCREYLRGELALLSTLTESGEVYVEASDEGLLALNRGFGVARPLTGDRLRALLGPEQQAALAGTTREHARRLHPRATLEWVVAGGRLYFVDYSAPDSSGQPAPGALSGPTVLSAGRARGRVQRLVIDDTLAESSIAPIISISEPVSAADETALLGQLTDRLRLGDEAGETGEPVIVAAARPVAVLSMLIGTVAGFVFEEGALLSHLGILLREAGVPAAIVGTGNLPDEGSLVDIVHGTVLELDVPATG